MTQDTPVTTAYRAPAKVSFELTKSEAMSAAWALKDNAVEAYCDQRYTVAATNYSLAARLFFLAGYNAKGNLCSQLATLVDQEAIAIASGADDEAQYASDTIQDLRSEQDYSAAARHKVDRETGGA